MFGLFVKIEKMVFHSRFAEKLIIRYWNDIGILYLSLDED